MANSVTTGDQALYLYGISMASGGKRIRIASDGIDGIHNVQALPCGNFLCWVSAVDRNGFAEAINKNMENLEWLALHGVRHQQVVAEIAEATTMIPARFGTIFSGEQALFKDVNSRKPALEKVFQRISGADEWGVKVFAEQSPAPAVAANVRSGKDYLEQKAARMQRRPETSGLQEFATTLEKIATDYGAHRQGERRPSKPAMAGHFSGAARQTQAVGPGPGRICEKMEWLAAHRSKWAVASVFFCLRCRMILKP